MSALAAIHVGLKQLGIDEDDARDLYERQTGQRSLRAMSPRQLDSVVGELRRLGFRSTSKGARKVLEGRFAKKLQALWIAAWNLGLVHNRDDSALIAFVKRQTGIDHVRFLRDADDARKAVEALKAWMKREAGVMWGNSNGYDFLKTDQGKIAWAQFQKLVPGATLMGNSAMLLAEVTAIVGDVPGSNLAALSPAQWRAVMNAFGERIRKAKGQ